MNEIRKAPSMLPMLVLFVIIQLLGGRLESAQARDEAGVFDYYTMALSWSPSFCETRAGQRSQRQCHGPRSYAFVLHGVWPQYDYKWPSNCYVRDSWVTERTIQSMLDIMPSRKLIIHEWKKHGTCSGLSPKGYFAMSRKLFNKIKIPARYINPQDYITVSPAQLEQDFLKTNRNLRANMISISCSRGRKLKELRICFDRNLNLTACGQNEDQQRLCRASKVVMPPVRGNSSKLLHRTSIKGHSDK